MKFFDDTKLGFTCSTKEYWNIAQEDLDELEN